MGKPETPASRTESRWIALMLLCGVALVAGAVLSALINTHVL